MTPTPTICLNMIVKNESKIITRLLQSVLPIIDCYCICDTGSTDNTEEVIVNFFKNHKITGKIIKEPFKNFAYNRNHALKACVGMSDYVLLLDADMLLQITNFKKDFLLNYDTCFILQGNVDFYYQNIRFVKNNGLFSYTGVTHEYVNIPDNSRHVAINKDDLFILDINDGGAKTDKYERDIRLLLDGIKESPNNDRYHFYLANSYFDTGIFDKAIEYYNKRVDLGGWDQEIWYSKYRIGLCYKGLSKMNDAVASWLEAFNYKPDRLENMYEIISYYREISKHNLAFCFYRLSKTILDQKVDREQYLFYHSDVYTYKIESEYAIIASYLGIHNINDSIIKILNNSNNSQCSMNLLSNMKFYKDILKPINKLIFNDSLVVNIKDDAVKMTSSSSCLIKNKKSDGYLLNVRFVNYYINEKGFYLNCEKNIITSNQFIELDSNLNKLNSKYFDIVYNNRQYIGIEDIRIFEDSVTNELLFIGTGFHSNNKLGVVEGKYDLNNTTLHYNEIHQTFKNTDCEKNWVYVEFNKETHIIYNWHPLQICHLNNREKHIVLVETKNTPKIFSFVRGSTCGFKYQNGMNNNSNTAETEIWFIGHIVSYEQPRHYYHIISVFDENMNLLRYSAPFKFEGEPIEYCLSIVVEPEKVIINYSTWDRTTIIGVYDKTYIDSLVKYT